MSLNDRSQVQELHFNAVTKGTVLHKLKCMAALNLDALSEALHGCSKT